MVQFPATYVHSNNFVPKSKIVSHHLSHMHHMILE